MVSPQESPQETGCGKCRNTGLAGVNVHLGSLSRLKRVRKELSVGVVGM